MGKSLEQIVKMSDFEWAGDIENELLDLDWKVRSSIIASRVLLYLKRKDTMDRAKLASILDVSVQYLSKLLKGNENLTLKTITRLEKATGMSLLRVIGEEKVKQKV